MTLYPIISTVYNEKHQSQIHTQYQEQVAQVDDRAIRKAKEAAQTQATEQAKDQYMKVDGKELPFR